MRAQVQSIESGRGYKDGEERIVLRFPDGEGLYNVLRVRRRVIDSTHSLKLDDEILLHIERAEPDSIKMAADAAGKAKAKLAGRAGVTNHDS